MFILKHFIHVPRKINTVFKKDARVEIQGWRYRGGKQCHGSEGMGIGAQGKCMDMNVKCIYIIASTFPSA